MNGSTRKSWLVRAVLPVLLASLAACGGLSSPSPAAPTPSTAVTLPVATAQRSPGLIALKAYFLLFGSVEGLTPLVPVHREVQGTIALARAAMEQLLAGPTAEERAHDLRVGTIGTGIPERTTLLGVGIVNGVATVDLSSEFASGDIAGEERESWAIRLAQVTYTLTQFPTVEQVRFLVEGQRAAAIEGHEGSPIDLATRDAYADQRPGIFVDNPAWGGAITDPLIVSGMAQIAIDPAQFEAALVDRATDEIIVQQTVRATCPAGCWQPPGGGAFQFQMSVPDEADGHDLLLAVWGVSADGGRFAFQQYPLR
jgi:germination protein M